MEGKGNVPLDWDRRRSRAQSELTRDRIKTSECLKREKETNDFGNCPPKDEQKGRKGGKKEEESGVSGLLMWEVTFQRSSLSPGEVFREYLYPLCQGVPLV